MSGNQNIFAKDTQVAPERSQAQIMELLTKHGASGFMIGTVDGDGLIQFEINGLPIQMRVPKPPLRHETPTGRMIWDEEQRKRNQLREWRQRWRIAKLVIQGRLELIALKISTVEAEFMANVVTGTGETIGERLIPQLQSAVESGDLPQLLPGSST